MVVAQKDIAAMVVFRESLRFLFLGSALVQGWPGFNMRQSKSVDISVVVLNSEMGKEFTNKR